MLRRNEMVAVLQNLDTYDAIAIINADGDPSIGLLKKLDASEPQTFMAVDGDGELIQTPLEVIYDPFTSEDILVWRPDADTPVLKGIRLATVQTQPIRTLVAEIASYVFGMGRTDAEEDVVIADFVSEATGGNADEQN